MFLLIYGDPESCKEVAAQLQTYFSYRGTVNYLYDYLTPLKEISESAAIAASHYLGKIQGFNEDKAAFEIERCLRDWSKEFLTPAAHEHLSDLSQRWRDLKAFYTLIIWNVTEEALKEFSPSYTVRIKKESHPLVREIIDCAECVIFDKVIDLNDLSPQEAADLIGESLHHKIMSAFSKPLDNNSQ